MARNNVFQYKARTKKLVSGLLLLSFFFGASVNSAGATTTIKILSNSRHAYGNITGIINTLLGTGHVGTDIIVHSTAMNDSYAGSSANAVLCTIISVPTSPVPSNVLMMPVMLPYA